ncbi:MAG: ABC transporter substrate-binding protein [Prolixibacteraceae bacterium]|nr:ABC transporter substrate-binding protein [Prolixibacteraceae bacterium]
MKFKKITNAFIALMVIAAVLLLSDLGNRVSPEKSRIKIKKAGLNAVEGHIYKLGLTYFAPEEAFDMTMKGLWQGMKELGFVKDSNLIVIAQHANGEMANLQPIHLNMDNMDVDAILVTSTPGIAAAVSAVKKHPIVFTMTYAPLEAGAGKSFTNHLPNITGVASFPPVEKTIDFIRETFPGTKRIGTLYNSSEANSRKVVAVGKEYCEKNGIELVENTVINTSEVYQAISALCLRNVDAVWISGDNTAIQAFHAIAKVCNEHQMPLVVNDVEFVDNGALAGVGIGWYETGYHSAPYVARILNGESPKGIPIENYVDEVIKLNMGLAEKWGITFPEKYMVRSNPLKGNNYKFSLTHYVDSPNSEDAEQGLREELKRNGLIEGKDFIIKVFNAQGDVSTMNSIADAVAAEKWDIVFVTSTPTTQTLVKKIQDMPIVFANVGDPIKAGLGKSFVNHLPHVTGISTMSDFEGLVQLVIESMPGIKTVGTVYTPGEVNSVAYKEKLEEAVKNKGLTLIAVPANTATEVADAALSIANRGIEAFTQISDNLTASCGSSIIKVAYDNRIPYFAFIAKQVEQGAVAAISRDYYNAGADAVLIAIEVLNGKSPGDIPYRYVSKSNVNVNKDAMEYFNVKVPEKYIQTEKKQ